MTETLSVQFVHTVASTGEISHEGKVSMDISAVRGGFIKEVGANRLPVLLAIMAFIDKDGRAYPSQRKLSELTGQSVNTITKIVNELLEIEYNGSHILSRELIQSDGGAKKKSVYTVHDAMMTHSGAFKAVAQVPEEYPDNPLTAKEVVIYFLNKYKEVYGIEYPVNWARDMGLAKKKLLNKFKTDEDLLAVIDFAVSNYQEKWANQSYPLPTLSMLSGWLGNSAFEIMSQGVKQEKAQEEKVYQSKVLDQSDQAFKLFD